MKYFFYSVIFLMAACSPKQESDNSVKGDSVSVDVKPQANPKEKPRAAVGAPLDREITYYNGLIGGKYSIEVTLSESEDSLMGQYRYTSQAEYLTLKGIIKNGEYLLQEYDPFGENTGRFNGKKEGEEIKGSWTNGKRKFPFVFNPKSKDEFAGAVTVATVEKEIKFGDCTCSSLLLPFVIKAASKEIQDSLNYELRMGAFTSGDEENICDCSEGGFAYGIISGSFDVLYNKGNILCIEWCAETMGAYPDFYCVYKNLDVRNGRLLSLSDIYEQEGVDYIINKTMEEINSRLGELANDEEVSEDSKDWVQELSQEKLEYSEVDRNAFSLDDKGITMRVNIGFPHAIQCYEPGGDVFIAYEDLVKWIKEGGVLANVE